MNNRIRASVLALALALPPTAWAQSALATYQFDSSGWATFGLALPQGAARDGVRVGSFQTQTDVKRRWPDGSIRHAVVTANVTSTGQYAIVTGAASSGTFTPTWPSASVDLVVGGTTYRAALPPFSGADSWLSSGTLVREARAVVTPVAGSSPHPSLRVVFDVRSYSTGGHRVDVAVNNTLNVAATNLVTYNVDVRIGGASVYSKSSVAQYSFTRWRKTFKTGLTEASYLPDPNAFIQSRALPKFLSSISRNGMPWTVSGGGFDILETGAVNPNMAQTGGRPELGCRPDWVAQFMVFRNANLFDAIKYYGGNPSGYFSVHITEPDGVSLVSLDVKPDFWLDPGRRYAAADGVSGPSNDMAGTSMPGDSSHYPSLAYPAYVLTGDRWYLDELKFTANYHLLRAHWERKGSTALYTSEQIRGVAWATRDLADAAGWLPDADPSRGYFENKLNNNLADLDARANSTADPLGSVSSMIANSQNPNDLPMWQVAYLTWALDHARRQGFTTYGLAILTKWATYQNTLLTSGSGWDRTKAVPYYFFARRQSDASYFRSFKEMWDYNYVTPYTPSSNPGGAPLDLADGYSAEAWLAAKVGLKLALPNAQANHDFVAGFSLNGLSVLDKTNQYPRFAVHVDSIGTSGTAVPSPPRSPSNVRILQ